MVDASMTETDGPSDPAALLEFTVELVSAYVSNNRVQSSDMPALIAGLHDALVHLVKPREAEAATVRPPLRMPIRKTVTDECLFSLEDGKPYQALKRHLRKLGLTPEQYREKWGLPHDYPMVAPAYARKRSALAKDMNLGSRRRTTGDD